ncbi:hypothetical protein C0991_002482, partial [Blastosporella zonata]
MPDLSRDFSRALEHNESYDTDPDEGIPSSLTRIHVRHFIGSTVDQNMWLRNAQKEMLKGLSGIIEKGERVAVVGMCHLLDYHEARLQWLEGEEFQLGP